MAQAAGAVVLGARLEQQEVGLGADKLVDYALQFAGVDGPDGKPLMVINAFCHPEHHPDRRTTWVGVDDGGDCYIEAYWERETRRFRGVSINGGA